MAFLYGLASMAGLVTGGFPLPQTQAPAPEDGPCAVASASVPAARQAGPARLSRCSWQSQCTNHTWGQHEGPGRGGCLAPTQAAPSPVLPAWGTSRPLQPSASAKRCPMALQSPGDLLSARSGAGAPVSSSSRKPGPQAEMGEHPWCLLPSFTQGWLSRTANAKPARHPGPMSNLTPQGRKGMLLKLCDVTFL